MLPCLFVLRLIIILQQMKTKIDTKNDMWIQENYTKALIIFSFSLILRYNFKKK